MLNDGYMVDVTFTVHIVTAHSMKIAIIGAGNIGGSLAKKWVKKGHNVMMGVRDASSAKVQSLQAEAQVQLGSQQEAAAYSDVIVLAVPFPAVQEVIKELGDVQNKVIIDCTNAMQGLPAGYSSAAEAIAAWSGSKKVVKAFNSTGAANTYQTGNDKKIDTFVCGDDLDAKVLVSQLAMDAGFTVVDAGGLGQAQLVEAMAKLWIQLAYKQGMGDKIAFKLVK